MPYRIRLVNRMDDDRPIITATHATVEEAGTHIGGFELGEFEEPNPGGGASASIGQEVEFVGDDGHARPLTDSEADSLHREIGAAMRRKSEGKLAPCDRRGSRQGHFPQQP